MDQKDKKKLYYAKNIEKWRGYYLRQKAKGEAFRVARCASSNRWAGRNKEQVLEKARRYYWAHREVILEKQKKYRKRKPELFKFLHARWLKNNYAAANAKVAERKARKKRAMPKWANRFFIAEAYDLAQLRSKIFNFPWHVDHIVPFWGIDRKTGKHIVCGLHTHHNLQVIPGVDNIRKHNVVWPDMP